MTTTTTRPKAPTGDKPGAGNGSSVGHSLGRLGAALARRAVTGAAGRLGSLTDELSGLADGGSPAASGVSKAAKDLSEGRSPLRAVTDAGLTGVKEKAGQGARGLAEAVGLGGGDGGGKGKGGALKMTTIVEAVDVGVPVDVAYDQWTMFTDFPSFMKKVEHVEQEEDDKLTWRAQVFWSHRSWNSTIIEQVPDERIVWRSSGEKGYADGAVTFHELAPSLTRILLVLEYHPKGFFEHVGNIWRAQGRRARLELKHFQRHVMTQVALHPEEVEGWRGEIHDGEVVPPEEVGRDEQEQDEAQRADRHGREGSDDEDVEEGDEAAYEDEDVEEGEEEDEDEEEARAGDDAEHEEDEDDEDDDAARAEERDDAAGSAAARSRS
jgi:uncharacterized membrane protein